MFSRVGASFVHRYETMMKTWTHGQEGDTRAEGTDESSFALRLRSSVLCII